ncbi:MAG: hypothetical protein AAB011_05465 [Candidatus Eisenbacteria bacterium]
MNSTSVPGQPADSGEVAPAFLVIRGIVGLLQFVCVALVFAPGLVSLATRQFGFEASLHEAWVRAAGVAGVLLTAVARVVLPGGGKTARVRTLTKLAAATGGTYRLEKRRIDQSGITGGPTIEWTVQGYPMTLTSASRSGQQAVTRIHVEIPCDKELSFNVLPNNFLTRTLTSPKFIQAVQSNIQRGEGDASETDRASAAKEIGLLAGADVPLSHPLLDGRLIAKSNDADLARDILTGGGVAERMYDLCEKRKSWTLSLYSAEQSGVSRLSLELQGSEAKPEVLVAGKALVEALLGNLIRNDVVETGSEERARMAAR